MNPSERCGIVVFRNEVPCLGSYSNGHSSCATECERINHGLEYDERFIRLHDAISKGFKMVLDKLRSEDSESEDSDEQKDEDNAPNLTVRIWAEILTNLNETQLANARLVCHRWKRIIDRSPSLVGKFVLSFPHGTTLDKHCELVRDVIASGMQHTQASLRKITLVGAAAWWPAVGGALISLTIADCKIPIDMLLDVLKLSPSLKRLDLTCGKNLYFHTVKAVDFQLETLENLCLTDIQYVKTLDVFQQMCPRLKVLRIPGRSKLAGFIDKLICFIKATRRTLEEVAIGGGTDLWEKLSDLNGLLLKRATFSYVAPERMVILSRNVPSIESLSIDWMKFEDEKLAKIGDNLPKLKSLTARIASPATFLNFMPELAQLSLNCSNHVISFSDLELHNLTSITLRSTKLTDNWHRHFPNMRSVALIKCTIDGSWSDLFLPVAQLGKLQHLLLYKVSVAVASDDVYIPDYLDSLSLLEIRKCRLPKATLHALIRFCPMLVRIDLQRVQGVDDDIRLAIGEGLKYLKEISIDDCVVRGDEFLEHTSKQCEGVEVNLTDCIGPSLSEGELSV
ncbi:uncharacterized protein LOC6042503 [Culex quinquefasciatus]|uniref:uncharacterized protein LOC6042503 n=1 Tax=Culex quinquefasciatus TaxID=7176 RepID=UPI0018E37E4E|nr:uncharacterized protein LOC6042503 [Culex quinquefasciatus]